jgi:hypothetical protein
MITKQFGQPVDIRMLSFLQISMNLNGLLVLHQSQLAIDVD